MLFCSIKRLIYGSNKQSCSVKSNSIASIKDVLVESFTKLEELYNQKGNVTGISTGFIDLDNKLQDDFKSLQIDAFYRIVVLFNHSF